MKNLSKMLKTEKEQKLFLDVLFYKFELPKNFHTGEILFKEEIWNYLFLCFIPFMKKEGFTIKKLKFKSIVFDSYEKEYDDFFKLSIYSPVSYSMRKWLNKKLHLPKDFRIEHSTPELIEILHPRNNCIQGGLNIVTAEILIMDFFLWNLGRLGYGLRK